MKLPLRWLAEYLEELPDPRVLAERLVMAGLEVESIRGPSVIDGATLVVGRIVEVEPHPNADRLTICSVEDGSGLRRIVCGASNVCAGGRVVVALPGATLPGGLTIRKTKIRGQESQGMICSATELGLWDDQSGILLLPADVRIGEPAAPLLGLNDTVLDVSVTANRGDCLSVRGLARELSALCGIPLTPAFDRQPHVTTSDAAFAVSIASPADCYLYRGLEITDLSPAQSPAWLIRKLASCGLRSVNSIVDVTNLVLLEYGQPLHAFDADRIHGRTVSVRAVTEPVTIETLDGQHRRLIAGDLAIWDAAGPIAIAGVMGGKRTAVEASTRSVFLESAWFRPGAVRVTSRRLGLISESSSRFERGVDPDSVERALLVAGALIAELGRARRISAIVAAGDPVPDRRRIRLRGERISRVLGSEIAVREVEAVLRALGAKPVSIHDGWWVEVPSHRHDLQREIDLIEELVRFRGYDSVQPEAPSRVMSEAPPSPQHAAQARTREALRSAGLTEAVSLAFCSEHENALFPGLHPAGSAAITVQNPMRAEADQMRRSLLPALLAARDTNARNGVTTVDLFSLGRTFARTATSDGEHAGTGAGGHQERESVAGLLWGPRRGRGPGAVGPVSFGDVKAVVERVLAVARALNGSQWISCDTRPEYHPGASAVVKVGGIQVGYLGIIHPTVAQELGIPFETGLFEIDSKNLLDYAPRDFVVRPLPRFPASGRDVSLLVPGGVLAGDVIAEITNLGETLVEGVSVFDEYVGEGVPPGHRALAFSIVYRSSERTLTEIEVSQLHARLVDHLQSALGVRVRA